MSYYNQNEIERQKEDALRRIKEMYSRSNWDSNRQSEEFSDTNGNYDMPIPKPPPDTVQFDTPPTPPLGTPPLNTPPLDTPPIPPIPPDNLYQKFFKRPLKLDKDSLILLGLLYLLYKENADKKLILAILYIFL